MSANGIGMNLGVVTTDPISAPKYLRWKLERIEIPKSVTPQDI